MLVVAASGTLVLAVDAFGVLTGPGTIGAARVLFVVAAGGLSLTAVVAAIWSNRRVEVCLRALNVSLVPESTIIQDVFSATARLSACTQRRLPMTAPFLSAAGRRAAGCHVWALHRAPWLRDALDTRHHPGQFACLVLAPLAALTVVYGIVQGLIVGSPASVAGPVMLAVFECSLAFMGYAALGPYLALR
jgi:hypothetical protein